MRGMKGYIGTFKDICAWLLLGLLGVGLVTAQGVDLGDFYGDDGTILTQKVEDVVSEEAGQGDGFQAGIEAFAGEGNIKGIYTGEIDDAATAWELATNLMKGTVNYFLGLIGLVAMLYLLYHGFLTLTAGSNAEQADKGREGIKYATYAIIGIALSWFLISLVFYVIFSVTQVGLVVAFDAEEYLRTNPYEESGLLAGGTGAESTDLGKELQEAVVAEDGILQDILKQLGFVIDSEQPLLAFINNLINFALMVVGLVAMIVLIYGFYKMFASSGEDGRTDAKKLVTNTIIALVVIGLARFITGRAFNLFYSSTVGIEG